MRMKKIFNIIFTVMAALAVLSCGSEVEIPEEPNNPNQPEQPSQPEEPEDPGFGGDVTFTATIESLSDGTQPTWKKGESISIFDGTSTVKSANTENDGAVAKFPATIQKGTENIFALYPANDGVRLNTTGVLLDIPTEQSTASPVPTYRVAKGKSDLLYFRNLVAVLNLSVGFDGVTSVVIKADDAAKIAGTLSVDYSGESPVVAASSSQIEIKGEFKNGETYPVVLAPATLTKCSVDAYVGDKVIAQIDLSGQTLKPGTVMDMPSMKPANPIYKITHMWVWGGSLPEWNCTAVLDLFTKADQFNKEDGRGIEAIKDNYLVFNSDGTFRNWAGEDGRNWWFVYDGQYNSESKTDVDVKQFYDVIPRSTGTYTKDENSIITFTMPDGSTTTATLVPAGNYEMPQTTENGGTAKVVTITSQALMFEIKGGREDITGDGGGLIYTDYWRIAGHPRVLFMEIEQMPDSFTVPTEAQTTDADFKFDPPVYEFDINTLPGTWNVLGGNSAPFGIWVNGGSGGDPAFVSPIEKSWCWNDSIYKESDNTLTIALTGYTATTVSGTIDWGAGEDGAYWDCIWNRADSHLNEDLSKYFGRIPKGVSNVTVDLQTGAGKIGTDIDFTFLTAGVHVFSCSKALEIPTKCFALAFHIMDPIPVIEADHYEDVDRFVNAPLDYVIIFEKK